MPRSFMVSPAQLASLEGQQYVVLRPSGPVMAAYERVQATAQSSLPSAVTYPHTGHVTLRAFFEPGRVEQLKGTVRKWAASQPLVDLRVDAIDSFPAPFKIVIARLGRTQSLVNAYADLSTMLDQTDFNRIGELSLGDWIFHMSVAYCSALPDDDWERLRTAIASQIVDRPVDAASNAEFVWYEGGAEHREVIAFAQAITSSSSAGVVP